MRYIVLWDSAKEDEPAWFVADTLNDNANATHTLRARQTGSPRAPYHMPQDLAADLAAWANEMGVEP